MYIVEVRRYSDALAGPMAEMRDWLDAHRIVPKLFKMSIAPNSVVFRLEFSSTGEAATFARAFDGRTVGDVEPSAAYYEAMGGSGSPRRRCLPAVQHPDFAKRRLLYAPATHVRAPTRFSIRWAEA